MSARPTLDQTKKLNYIEQKLAAFRDEYPKAHISRQKTILLQVRSLKNAYYKITGKEYQKPML